MICRKPCALCPLLPEQFPGPSSGFCGCFFFFPSSEIRMLPRTLGPQTLLFHGCYGSKPQPPACSSILVDQCCSFASAFSELPSFSHTILPHPDATLYLSTLFWRDSLAIT